MDDFETLNVLQDAAVAKDDIASGAVLGVVGGAGALGLTTPSEGWHRAEIEPLPGLDGLLDGEHNVGG
eukprot:9483827-Alexandrium_andersonii.AAC.1